MTTTFETAKVGDKVWSIVYGWGEISDILPHEKYPIEVTFNSTDNFYEDQYTYCGKALITLPSQSLFWDEIKIVAPSKPLPNLPIDTKVLVWKDGGDKIPRHFYRFDESGKAECYLEGQTSWTTDGGTAYWENWELAE